MKEEKGKKRRGMGRRREARGKEEKGKKRRGMGRRREAREEEGKKTRPEQASHPWRGILAM